MSEAIWEDLNSRFFWGRGSMPPDPPSRYARYYHPATILFPPQLKILYETLHFISGKSVPPSLKSYAQTGWPTRDLNHSKLSMKRVAIDETNSTVSMSQALKKGFGRLSILIPVTNACRTSFRDIRPPLPESPPPFLELVNTAWDVRARLVMPPQAFNRQLSLLHFFLNEPLPCGTTQWWRGWLLCVLLLRPQ